MKKQNIIHGSAVVVSGGAVLLRGASGSGKSDLAFRLVQAGGTLIADDQVELKQRLNLVYAESVDTVKGILEVRGVGLVKLPFAHATSIKLVVDLVPREKMPRLPEWEAITLLGVDVPCLKLYAFDASTPLKIQLAMTLVDKRDLLVK